MNRHGRIEKGYAVTMCGRAPYSGIWSAQSSAYCAGERTAMNHPMQGSAADIIEIAMIRVEKRLRKEGCAELILQIHDELILKCQMMK